MIGFTGTKYGMQQDQEKGVFKLLLKFRMNHDEFHHGDCIGADEQAATLAWRLHYTMVCHPPIIETRRAFFEHNDRTNPPFDYIVRDHHIVDDTLILIAAPHTSYEITRSGTWATVRYAREKHRPIYKVLPDGTIETENVTSLPNQY